MGSSPTIDRNVFISQNWAIVLIRNCSTSIYLIIGFTSTVGELILRSASRLKQKFFWYNLWFGPSTAVKPQRTHCMHKMALQDKNLPFLLLMYFGAQYYNLEVSFLILWLVLSSSTPQEMSQIVNH